MNEFEPTTITPLRCKAGDRVMFVAGRLDLLGRIGFVHCATVDAIEWARPDEITHILRRDWVVEVEGEIIRSESDGVTFETHVVSVCDRHLMPLRHDLVQVDSEEEASV